MDDELLKINEMLKYKTYEEKKNIVADILCDQWYLKEHHDFIKQVLDVFYKSHSWLKLRHKLPHNR